MSKLTESILNNFDIMREKAFLEAEPSIDTDTLTATSDINVKSKDRLNNLFAWISDHAVDDDLNFFLDECGITMDQFENPDLIDDADVDNIEYEAKNWIGDHIADEDVPGLADQGIDLESENLTESSDISEIYKTYTIRIDNLIKEAKDVFYKEAVDEDNAKATFENFIWDVAKIADDYKLADYYDNDEDDLDESEKLTEDTVPASVLDFKHTELKKVQDNISLIAGLKAEEPANELYTKLMDAYDKVQKALEDVIEEDPVGTVVTDTPTSTEPETEEEPVKEEPAEEVLDEPEMDSEEPEEEI